MNNVQVPENIKIWRIVGKIACPQCQSETCLLKERKGKYKYNCMSKGCNKTGKIKFR